MSTEDAKPEEVKSQFGQPNTSKKKEEKGKVKFEELVYGPEFVLASIDIPRKEILDYIRGKAYLLGEDYYYGYIYKDGKLGFIALKTDGYTAGKLATLSLPLLYEGDFYFHPDDTGLVYMISHRHGTIKTEVGHSVKPDFTDLKNLPMPDHKDVPKTLYLKWALQRKINKASIVYAAIFVGALLYFATATSSFKSLSAEAELAKPKAVAADTVKKHIDVAKTVAKIGALVDGKGVITRVGMAKDQLEFKIQFNDGNDAEAFIVLNGGRYENGQVVYLAPSADHL